MAPMVVSSSVGVLGPLLVKLTGLLAGEYGRLKGVRREIISFRCELSSMHAVVKKYAMLDDPDVQVKEWISLVRELAYDIEDCIDMFIHRLGNRRSHGGFKEFFRKTIRQVKILGARRDIASKIDKLKYRIKQVKELKDSYKLDGIARSTHSHAAADPRLCALFTEKAHLVGLDGPRDGLAKWIIEGGRNTTKHHRRVLSIVGFGGLGKTTLANEIYRKIEAHFHCTAFVSVSQKPDLKKIIKDVISHCQDGSTIDTYGWDERRSIAKLGELLQDKRYLIVIDDIWSTSAWDALKYAFPEKSCSSRIIVTTRIVDVARSCCQPGHEDSVYEMQSLSDDHSKSLFFRRIFGLRDCCPEMLKEVSSEILKKCGGLPLAIICISGLLANKLPIKEEWEKVKRSIGSALEKGQNLEGMNKILSLSYNSLPPNLKTCLLYLSVFPEDYEIERERIVMRWIAEGFISEERGQSRQEVAEKYFYELINRNMVQPVGIGYDSKVRGCRVHDMMLEILISKSAEDNFITVLGGGQTSLSNRHCFIRRLSVQDVDQELVSALANEDLSHVRSLTISSGCVKHMPSLVQFEALRVLDFEDNGWESADHECLDDYIMDGMDKLLQLNYLGLRGTHTSKLPSGIVMLRDLKTLDISDTCVQELPAGIDLLTNLEYLLTKGQVDMSIPNGIGNMRNLRVISGFSINLSSADAVEDLGNLESLDKLDLIWGRGGSDEYKSHEDILLSSLCNLSSWKLKGLRIAMMNGSFGILDSWSPSPFFVHICLIGYYFTRVPKWIGPVLTSLASLDINLTELTEEGMRTLGELTNLLHLKLSLKPKPIDRVTVQGTGFPSLKEFVLYGFDGGAYITFVNGAMLKLENLTLFPMELSLAQTYSFYLGIEHLPCLKKVIWFYNYGTTSSQRKAATAGIKNEAVAHPNHLALFLGGEHNEENSKDEEKTKEAGGTDKNENCHLLVQNDPYHHLQEVDVQMACPELSPESTGLAPSNDQEHEKHRMKHGSLQKRQVSA